MKTVFAALLAFSCLSVFAHEHEGKMGPPPKEALAACKTLKADAACTFKGKEGKEVTGKCWTPEATKPLACKPAHAEGDGHAH